MARRGPGTFSHFLPSLVAKHQKSEEGPFGEKKVFLKKSHNAEKNNRGFGIFQHPFSRQESNKLKGKMEFFLKKVTMPKKLKGGPLLSRPVWHVTRKNMKNLFGSVRQAK